MTLKSFFCLICSAVLLTGCWDTKEIEDVGIVTGLALDVAEEDHMLMINQYVKPGQIPTQQDSSQTDSPYQNLESTGTTLFEMIRENSLESNRPPNYTHLKSILFSTKLLEKEQLSQLIDLYIRDHEFRRTVPVFITMDPVQKIFNAQPEKELFPSIQIKELSENYHKNNTNPKNLTIGDMSQYISEKRSFIIPGMAMINGNIKSYGAGVISGKTSQYIGWIPLEKMEGIRYLHNNVEGGYIYLSEKNIADGPVVLEIKGADSNFDVSFSDGELSMSVDVKVTTSLGEDWGVDRNVFKTGWEEGIKEAADKNIEDKINTILQIAQKELETDFVHLSQWVRIHQPDYWNKHKEEWDDIFPQIDIDVQADVSIKDFGTQNFNMK